MSTTRAFDKALIRFKKDLTDREKLDFAVTSIDDVYAEAKKIQEKQADRGSLRNMRRMQPYLNGLSQFATVIEVFVQAKPEIMSFVWGPTKFLLQVASNFTKSFDTLLDAFQKIGENLPRFVKYADIFHDNPQMQQVISLIYEDILNFHRSTLKFFRMKAWQQIFMSLWRTFEDSFGVILNNLNRHKDLIDNEATAAHIFAAYEDRKVALLEDQRRQQNRDRECIRELKAWLSPISYEIEKLNCRDIRSQYPNTGNWLLGDNKFKAWLDPGTAMSNSSFLWLTGIPGSGKTILTSLIIDHTKLSRQVTDSVVFAFLKSGNDKQNTFAAIMRTLIFQLSLENKILLHDIHEKYASSNFSYPNSREELEDILQTMLGNIGVTYFIIDGLDEIESVESKKLLSSLLAIQSKNDNVKIFLSSRTEADISRTLSKVPQIKIGEANKEDIATYTSIEGKQLAGRFGFNDSDDARKEIDGMLTLVASRAEGMFLWVRLVIYNLMQQTTWEELQYAVGDLPKGLEEAYGRILKRIDDKLGPNEKSQARRILEWVVCANRPLTLREVEFALTIRVGDRCFVKKRRLLRKLDELCGPIVEVQKDGVVSFVHFSAKEYLINKFSGPFIHAPTAHSMIARTCLSYLLFTCFDDTLDNSQIISCIYNGDYCLDHYAETSWIEHVKNASGCCEDDLNDLIELLKSFIRQRRNARHQFPVPLKPEVQEFLVLQTRDLSLYEALNGIYAQQSRGIYESSFSDSDTINPLQLRSSINRAREVFESHILSLSSRGEETRLNSVREIYGSHLFKCRQQTCPYFHKGFETLKDRETHSRKHSRAFKCGIATCQFHSFGFISAQALEKHTSDHHKTITSTFLTEPNSDDLPDDISKCLENHSDSAALILDCLRTDNVILLEKLLDLNTSESLQQGGHTLLEHAAANGSENCVRLLLRQGENVPNSAVFSAINGSASILELLIDNGADLAIRNLDGDTLLLYAVKSKAYTSVKLLLERGANMVETNASIETPLSVAWRKGLWTIAQMLLDYGAPEPRDKGAQDAGLLLAVKEENETMVRLVLRKGASVHAQEKALISALRGRPEALKGREGIVRSLLECGALVEADAALAIAIRNGWDTVIQLPVFSNNESLYTALVKAIKVGEEATVRLILKNKSCVSGRRLSSLLGMAIERKEEGVVQAFVEYGVQVKPEKILDIAIKNEWKTVSRLLLENNAIDFEWRDDHWRSLTTIASQTSYGMLLFLSNHDPSRYMTLVRAIVHGEEEEEAKVQPILKSGFDASGKLAPPLLDLAVKYKRERIVETFVEHGVEVEMKRERLLGIAIRKKWKTVARLLLENNTIDFEWTDDGLRSLTSIASQTDHEMLLFLSKHDPSRHMALLRAIVLGKDGEATVRSILEDGFDTSSRRVSALLDIALEHKQEEIAQAFVEYGVEVEPPEKILSIAIQNEWKTVAQLLLEKNTINFGWRLNKYGGSLTTTASRTGYEMLLFLSHHDPSRYMALLRAVREGEEVAVRSALKSGFDVSGQNGSDLLCIAVRGKKERIIQAFAEYKVQSEMALSIAMRNEWEPAVRILLANSTVDLNREVSYGETIMTIAAQVRDKKILQHLSNYELSLYTALVGSHKERGGAVLSILEKDFESGTLGQRGERFLIGALGGEDEGLVLALLAMHIEYRAIAEPERVLCIAIRKSWDKVVRATLDKMKPSSSYLNQKWKDESGDTLLELAAATGQEEIMQHLLKIEAYEPLPDLLVGNKRAALLKAIINDQELMVELLLDSGVDLEKGFGSEVLSLTSNPKIIQALVAHGIWRRNLR